mmetsp:Transcript_56221/g.114971  ORF Transcript_56221/g.114971 Transcript_56221/m.114971 type:complete len:92 (-) Transcript_56221:202-477(-)
MGMCEDSDTGANRNLGWTCCSVVDSVVIFPRRKLGQSQRSNDGQPVRLTKDIITHLLHLRVHDAANKLGIRTTVLKIACCKLGIEFWPENK